MSHWPKIRPTIDELVNRQFETREFKKLFAVPLTARRVEVYQNHMTFMPTTGAIVGRLLRAKHRSTSSGRSGSMKRMS